jgi:uncharacterized protein YjbI with pentapeptide repeats
LLEGRIRLPLAEVDIAAVLFFLAAPLIVFAAFVALRSKARLKGPVFVILDVTLFLNAFRSLKLHDPYISYFSAGMAFAGMAWTSWIWASSRPFHGRQSRAGNALVALGLAAALVIEGVLVFYLIPWSLRGDLPGTWNNYPFGQALRSVLYANLSGYERPAGSGPGRFRGIHLEGANLRNAKLKGVDLRDAELFRARLDLAELAGADLRGAKMVEVRFSFTDLRNADLSGADLSGAYSMGADVRNAVFRGSSQHYQRFNNADARGADFSSAKLSRALFFGSDLRGASFRNAGLPYANLVRVRLDGADLTGASLSNAQFHQTVLKGADLGNANLGGAIDLFPDALAEAGSLRGANLDPALRVDLERRYPALF